MLVAPRNRLSALLRKRQIAAVLVGLVAVSCSDKSPQTTTGSGGGTQTTGSGGTSGTNITTCVPGHSVACVCPGGLQGTQTCQADGLSYAACDCTAPPAGCGNGIVESGEECDDGNTHNGDGCNLNCQAESAVPLSDGEPTNSVPMGPNGSVAFTACNDETTTQAFAPGGPITIRACAVSYLDSAQVGVTQTAINNEFTGAQAFFDASGANIQFNLLHVDTVTGSSKETDPHGQSELDDLHLSTRKYVELHHPGECDVVVGYTNTLHSDTASIGGQATFPPSGLQECLVARGNVGTGESTAHELGHVLGLFHTFTSPDDGCQDTPTDPNCFVGGGCGAQCAPAAVAHNVMSYYHCNMPQADSFSACQVRRARCYITHMLDSTATVCGDGICAPTETLQSCCQDCGSVCGGVCVDSATNNNNCGGCGITCTAQAPSVAQCTAGRCLVTLLKDQPLASLGSMVVRSNRIFWESPLDQQIMSMSTNGGTPTVLASGQDSLSSITADSTYVYWTKFKSSGEILRVPMSGGAPVVLESGQYLPAAVSISNGSMYWTTGGGNVSGSIMRASTTGGPVTMLTTGAWLPLGLTVHGGTVFWTTNTGGTGTVMGIPTSGGSAITLATGQATPRFPLVDAAGLTLFWLNYSSSSGGVMSIPLAGGSPSVLYGGNVKGLASDGESLYFVKNTNILRLPIGGTTPVIVYSGQSYTPSALTIDATSIYWNVSGSPFDGNGKIMKMTPK